MGAVATTGAGDERGLLMMPQVGDEVLVAFEHGDVRRPYVLGSLWNGNDTPGATSPQTDGSFALRSDARRSACTPHDAITHREPTATSPSTARRRALATKSDDAQRRIEGQNVTVKASSSLTIEATGELTIKGAGDHRRTSSGAVQVSGAPIMLG